MKIKKTTLLALVKKAGLDPESEAWKSITGAAAPEESDDELPAANFVALDGALLNLEAAKAHPEVEKAFKGQLYSHVDTKLTAFLKTLGLDDATIKTTLDTKPTPDKVTAALEAAVAKSKGDGKHSDQQREQQWQTKQTELETKLATESAARTQAEQTAQTLERDYALTTYLSDSTRFPLRSDLPQVGKYSRAEILEAVAKKGAQLVIKDGQPFLAMKDDATKPFHEAGVATPLNLDEFTKTTLDSAGFINKQPGNQIQNLNQPIQQPHNQNQPPVDNAAAASMAANLAVINAPGDAAQ